MECRPTSALLWSIVCLGILNYPVQAQNNELVLCYINDMCAAAGQFQNNMTIEDCCLNSPDGFTYRRVGSEICENCIVYGFFNTSITQPELGQSYNVRVGYLKGAGTPNATTLTFNVFNTPGTAREGPSFDYIVNTNFIRATRDLVMNVVFILRMDSIAQENNETFTIELVPRAGTNIPTGDGAFFENTVEVTIIDSDNVQISFTEEDYRVSETNITGSVSFIPVKVAKNSRIANSIVLDVIPLTVFEARNRPPGLPGNVPSDNPFSPPFANLLDFDNTIIRITFDANEDQDDNERDAPVPITNDKVNEAIEQVFVVHLILINSSNPGSINLTRQSTSLCRVIDDDSISIGFELPSYTYNEPMFMEIIDEFFFPPNNLKAYGPIFLIKENNVTSEQTFLIVIEVTGSVSEGANPATLGPNGDYEVAGGNTVANITFVPNQQRLNFGLMLNPDNIPEGTEAFLATSLRQDTAESAEGVVFPLPDYLNPTYASTFINILDDDPIIIGFENITYTVDEAAGMLEVNVRVTNPPIDIPLFTSIEVVIQTRAVNATGGVDYRELNAEALDVVLTFDDRNRRQSFMLDIFNDEQFESAEQFDVELRFNPLPDSSPPTSVEVLLHPNVTTVYILDDNVTIGFLNAPYSVLEGNGQLNIVIAKMEGSILVDIVLLVHYFAVQHNAMNDNISSSELVLTPAMTNITLPMVESVFDVSVAEVWINISLLEGPESRVTLHPQTALIQLDASVIGFSDEVYSVNEDEGTVAIEVRERGGQSQCNESEWTLQFSIIGDILNDINISNGLNFSVSSEPHNLVIPIVDDDILEVNETFTATISLTRMEDRNCVVFRPGTLEITIIDNDDVEIGFSPSNYTFTEGVDGDVSLNLSVLSGRLGRDVVVSLHTHGEDLATDGSDFNIDIRSVTFSEQEQHIVIPIEIVDDNVFENIIENFTLTLSTDVPHVLLVNRAVVNIRDNDRILIGLDSTSYTVNESEGTKLVMIAVDVQESIISEDITAQVVLATVSATAMSNDYEEVYTVLSFTNTSFVQNVSLTIIDDRLLESEEHFVVTLTQVNEEDRVIIQPESANVTILDNDTVVIGFMNESYVVTEGDGFVNVTVGVLLGGLGREVIVTLSTQVDTVPDNSDFEVIRDHPLTFDSNKSNITVSIRITTDEHLEEDEQFIVTLSARVLRLQLNTNSVVNLKNAVCENSENSNLFSLSNDTFEGSEDVSFSLDHILLSQENGLLSLTLANNESDRVSVGPSETTVTILDDDSIVIGFNDTAYPVNECDGNVNIGIVVKQGSLQKQVVVVFSTTKNGDSVVDVYEHVTNRLLTFDSTHTSYGETISIMAVLNDTMPLVDQEFIVNLSLLGEPDPGVSLEPNNATVKIFEIHGVIGFISPDPIIVVNEYVGQINITVGLLSGAICGQVEFGYSTYCSTATAGEDFNQTDSLQVLTLSTHHPNGTITIDIIDDDITECVESFSIDLAFLSGDIDRVELNPSNVNVTIIDDDKSVVGFLTPEQNISESSDPALRKVNITFGLISGELCDSVVVHYSVVANSTADAIDDFFLDEGSVSLTSANRNHTITVDIVDDDQRESPEHVRIGLSFSEQESASRVILSPSLTMITIMDNDVSAVSALAVGLGALGGILFIIVIVIIFITVISFFLVKRRKQKALNQGTTESGDLLMSFSVQSSYKLNISPSLLVASSNIRMTETVGQGEFGIVFKGNIVIGGVVSEIVAIKTLKGVYDRTAIRDMLKECSKMEKFDHPNVLTLRGVCLDGGPSPFIIMPFMSNGSLLNYLKKNRATLVVSKTESENDENVKIVGKRLIDMCLQVALGMEYLAHQKLVHRDLAARNCMIDSNYIIKVADFGLSESVGTKDYFRQDKLAAVRLPLKWLAPEGLEDFIFSEKSDVWAYGVTCWEIFTAGKVPYASIHLSDLLRSLLNGQRLDKPSNDACSDKLYTLMLHCWKEEPQGRPTFSDIVSSLSQSLEAMSDYMNISAFGHEHVTDPIDDCDAEGKVEAKKAIKETTDKETVL